MRLKRFLLFVFPTYYPVGGFEDFEGDFDTLQEAREKKNEIFKERGPKYLDYQIIDSHFTTIPPTKRWIYVETQSSTPEEKENVDAWYGITEKEKGEEKNENS